MTVITYTRSARCKDCKLLKAEYKGKRKTHYCNNSVSDKFNQSRTLQDLVCDVWEL